jgi:hypothetical protein
MVNLGTGLLAVWMEIKPELLPAADDDLNEWYKKSHLPERAAVPGFIRSRRYVSVEGGPKYCALYDLESLDVLQSEGYRNLRNSPDREWTRRIGQSLEKNIRREYALLNQAGKLQQESSPAVLCVRLDVAPEAEAELNDFYDNENLPRVAEVPGVLGIRRFESRTEGAPKYLAIYELAGPEVTQSQAWKDALASPRGPKLWSQFSNYESNLGTLLYSMP